MIFDRGSWDGVDGKNEMVRLMKKVVSVLVGMHVDVSALLWSEATDGSSFGALLSNFRMTDWCFVLQRPCSCSVSVGDPQMKRSSCRVSVVGLVNVGITYDHLLSNVNIDASRRISPRYGLPRRRACALACILYNELTMLLLYLYMALYMLG